MAGGLPTGLPPLITVNRVRPDQYKKTHAQGHAGSGIAEMALASLHLPATGCATSTLMGNPAMTLPAEQPVGERWPGTGFAILSGHRR
jgi:hypothetical protein